MPGLRSALGLTEDAPIAEVDRIEAEAKALVTALAESGWDPGCLHWSDRQPGCAGRPCASPPSRSCRGCAGPPTSSPRPCTRWTAATCRPGRPGSPLRGLVNVLPTGRNFYSVDPKAIPSRLAWQTGRRWPTRCCGATSTTPASTRARSGCRSGGPRRCAPAATTSPRCSPCSACCRSGTRRPGGWSGSRRSTLDELGRPRIDVTVRISGFFRDAFPHVVAMLDDAVRLVAELDEPLELQLRPGPRRRPTWPSTVTSGGPPPGSSGPSPARTAPASCR